MTVIIPEGYAQLTLIYTGPMFVSGGGATVLGFGGESDPITTIPIFADALAGSWIDNIKPITDSNLRLERIHWAGPTQSGDVPVAEAGGQSRTSISPNVATLVSYTSLFKGRRGRGRSYLPALLAQTEVDESGAITLTKVDTIQAAINSFFGDLPASPQVILQRDEPGQKTPPLDPPPEVVSRTVAVRAASQRRRLRR